MSKINIPTCVLPNSECDVLFRSVSDKLNIQKPQFYYPIYDKIIDNANETRGLVFDSKFKVREILSKVLDTDSDDYETDDETDDGTIGNNAGVDFTFNLDDNSKLDEKNSSGTDNTLEEVFNNNTDIDLVKASNAKLQSSDNEVQETDDREIDDAINNIFTANARVERINKQTGEKTIKEEQIHIKKSALLEPLKVLKDEFLIPARLKNQSLADETLQRTRAKLDSYNNSAHVESLFLYLGNKLVESGKCPSFPYYYGCINGEDPNYHHDITDEYDMVSRTRWFRQRVKTDFDLLILEGDDMDNAEKEMLEKMHRPQSHRRFQDGGNSPSSVGSHTASESSSETGDATGDATRDSCNDFKTYKDYINKSLGLGLDNSNFDGKETDDANVDADVENNDDNDDADVDNDDDNEDIETALEFLDKNSSNDEECNQDCHQDCTQDCINGASNNIIPIDDIDSTLNNILTDIENRAVSGSNSTDFINNIGTLDDLNLDDLQLDNVNETETENTTNITSTELNKPVIVSEDHLDDDLIEVLSDIDKDALTMSDFEDNSSNNQYYLKCAQMPVSLCMMEKLDQTLDDLLDEGYNMSEVEWFSVFFQVAFGLATAQKYFNFVHNDLHSSNVMFKATELRNLFFQIGNTYYRVPTYGKITKIIDFARGTFKLGDRWIFSDQFKEDGDAWGQYDYPADGTLANCEYKPNPSFDLVRLGTTVIQRLDDTPAVREFVESITRDDYDNSLCYEEDTFQLYIDIAHNAHNAVPIEVLARPEFDRFKVSKDRVPKGVYVFKY